MQRDPNQLIPPRSGESRPVRLTGRAPRLALSALLGFAVLVFAVAAMASTRATAGTIGSFALTGQVSATLAVPEEFTHTMVMAGTTVPGVALYGCQVGQEDTGIVINIPNQTMKLNGHSVAATGVGFELTVVKDGNSEAITPSNESVVFDLVVSGRDYQWQGTSGTISTKANGEGGSFNAVLIPSRVDPGVGIPFDNASKSVHVHGSWTSCHPFA